MEMPPETLTHEDLVKYDRAWSEKEVERIQQKWAEYKDKPLEDPPESENKNTLAELVLGLSDDIQHVRFIHKPYGEIYIYIKTKYLDGVPVPALCDWIKEQVNQPQNMLVAYRVVDVLPMSEWHKFWSEQGQEAERRRRDSEIARSD